MPPPFEHPVFQIVRHIYSGTLTEVYEAVDARTEGRRFALKVLRDYRAAPRFQQIAVVTASLLHPAIVPCHMVGEHEARPFMETALVDGDNLHQGISQSRRTSEEVVRIVSEVGQALDYANGRSIIHGYVHPRHILLGNDGHVWLIGFGECPAPARAYVSPPIHLAPEQMGADECQVPQVDVYGLAETAYWLLTGVHPFQTVPHSELHQVKQAYPEWGREGLGPYLPPAVRRTLRKAMAPKPEDRFPSAGSFARALDEALRPKKWWRFWK